MSTEKAHVLPRWLWLGGLGLMTLPLAGALVLIVALALGWNNPRPTRPPDWQAPNLPLRLEAASSDTVVELLGYPCQDFTLEVEATPMSGPDFNGYGLVYRAQDEARYTVFAVGSDGYYGVMRLEGGAETPLVDWQQFPHIRRGRQANRLRVACARATCQFYINDEYATSVEDDTWTTGDVGLWVRSFEDGAVAAEFVHVRVWVERIVQTS